MVRRLLARLFIGLGLLAAIPSAEAHFTLNGRNRIIILDRSADSADLFLRIPAPLIYARELSMRGPDGRVEAPFLSIKASPAGWIHRLDRAAVATMPEDFAGFAASGYRITVNGTEVSAIPVAVAVHLARDAPPFATPEDARAAVAGKTEGRGDPFVGEAVVDLALHLDGIDGYGDIGISATLPKLQLPPDMFIDNHILDFDGTEVRAITKAGQLHDGVLLNRSLPWSVLTFVSEGIWHILKGVDHVLFVLCLTLAASSLGRLLWSVTGFTIGHSVTLIGGFLGLAPSGAWFVPAVEAAISISIIYAGAMALFGKSSLRTVWVTTVIGLLHGFGFSFVLSDILGRDSPNLLVSLFSFNAGVEVGQVLIVAVAWGLLLAARRMHWKVAFGLRAAVAAGSIAIACFWAVERAAILTGAI